MPNALVVVAACAAAGGIAVTGIDASVATAPLLPTIRAAGVLPDTVAAPQAGEPVVALTVYRDPSEPQPSPVPTFLEEPPRRYTKEEVRIIAAVAGWPGDLLAEVEEVAWCESRNDALAVNGTFRGLMQVYPLWFDYAGIAPERWDDPVANMRVALFAYQYDVDHGYEPWTQWQCRPGGRYVPASAFAPPLPSPTSDVAAAIATVEAIATPLPSPTPMPAPWEQPPLWPPQSGEPAQPVPTPSVGAVEPLIPITPTPAP